MRVDGVIIQDSKTNVYTGFIKQYPGVCAQSDSVDDLKAKLDKYLHLYFQYVDKTGISLESNEIYSV